MSKPDQRVFDAINQAIDTHAPKLIESVRIAIATDAALKIAGIVAGDVETDRRFHQDLADRDMQ